MVFFEPATRRYSTVGLYLTFYNPIYARLGFNSYICILSIIIYIYTNLHHVQKYKSIHIFEGMPNRTYAYICIILLHYLHVCMRLNLWHICITYILVRFIHIKNTHTIYDFVKFQFNLKLSNLFRSTINHNCNQKHRRYFICNCRYNKLDIDHYIFN